jgi:hypothetical protein
MVTRSPATSGCTRDPGVSSGSPFVSMPIAHTAGVATPDYSARSMHMPPWPNAGNTAPTAYRSATGTPATRTTGLRCLLANAYSL